MSIWCVNSSLIPNIHYVISAPVHALCVSPVMMPDVSRELCIIMASHSVRKSIVFVRRLYSLTSIHETCSTLLIDSFQANTYIKHATLHST